DLSDDLLMLRSGVAWFPREDGEASQCFPVGREYRRGPARLQPMRQRQITIVRGQRVGGDVGDNDLLLEKGCPPARTRRRADGSAAKRTDVAGRQTGSGAGPKPVVVRIQQQNRAERTAGNLLHQPANSIED